MLDCIMTSEILYQNNKLDFNELEKYMLYNNTNKNIHNKEKLSKIFNSNNNNINNINNNKIKYNNKFQDNNKFEYNNKAQDNKFNKIKKNDIENYNYSPKNNDKLLWCLYICRYGISKYNLNYTICFSIEKQLKIDCINFINNNKNNLNFKIKKNFVENNLLYDKYISIQSFSILTNFLNINIRLIYNNFYYEFLNNSDDEFKYIYNNNNNYNNYYIDIENKPFNIDDKYLITNLCKPINSISFYKLSDILYIANKLNIDSTINNKKKTKNQIYDEISTLINKIK